MTHEQIAEKLKDFVNDLLIEIQDENEITDGHADGIESEMDETVETLTEQIEELIRFQLFYKALNSKNSEKIEEEYCESSDTTFLVKYTYKDGELKSREVISFYSGEPNEADTAFYSQNGGTKCEYDAL